MRPPRPPFDIFQHRPSQHPAYYQMRPNNQQQYAFMRAQQMSSNPRVVMPSRAGGRAERMQITRLPFYDVMGVVLKMSELQPLSGRSGDVRSILPFTIQPEHLPLISYRGDQPTPRYELQLRMFLFDADIEQADDFPPNCVIRVDDNPVALPGIIPTNKPNAEQKRYSRPVDITQYIQSSRLNINRQHKLEIDWFSDRRTWAVGIWLVQRQNANILLDRMLTTGFRRTADETKKKIAVMLDGDDDNIALDQLKISLLCPLMKTRMNIPARTRTCSHLQCFDLSNYLNMCEKRPVWKCPQCNGNAHYDNLIIDQYFMDLLKAVEHNVEEVELSRDGNWKILEVACDTLSDDDDDISPTKAVKAEESSTSAPSKTNKAGKKDAEEIITLDDSDDDNTPGSSGPASRAFPLPSSVSTNLSSDAPTPPRTPLTTNGSNMPTTKSSSSSGPQAKQGRMDDSSAGRLTEIRQSRSSSTSSSDESSQDSNNSRRRKIPASLRTTTNNGKSATTSATLSSTTAAAKPPTKKLKDAEIITIDSSDDEEEAPPAQITESTSRSNSNGYSNGASRSTDSNSPLLNGTNGTASSKQRQNGVHSDVAKRSQFTSSRVSEAIEYEVADGLTQFINSVFLRDTRPSTFTAS